VDNQHKKITGYRDLSADEIASMNTAKSREREIMSLLDSLADAPETDQRWLAIGRTHIEQGFMAVVRSIVRPTLQPAEQPIKLDNPSAIACDVSCVNCQQSWVHSHYRERAVPEYVQCPDCGHTQRLDNATCSEYWEFDGGDVGMDIVYVNKGAEG